MDVLLELTFCEGAERGKSLNEAGKKRLQSAEERAGGTQVSCLLLVNDDSVGS